MTFRQAISTSKGLGMRALLQPRVAQFPTYRRRFLLFFFSFFSYIEANVRTWSNLFANTPHHPRHWPVCQNSSSSSSLTYWQHSSSPPPPTSCEHSSSPSSFINRRLRLFSNADNTPYLRLHNKKHFYQLIAVRSSCSSPAVYCPFYLLWVTSWINLPVSLTPHSPGHCEYLFASVGYSFRA